MLGYAPGPIIYGSICDATGYFIFNILEEYNLVGE